MSCFPDVGRAFAKPRGSLLLRTQQSRAQPKAAHRRVELDAIRGSAVLLVVLYHAIIALDLIGTDAPSWLARFNDAVTPFRIPTLVYLSGLLLSRSLRKPAGQYVRGKLRRLAWPYLVWTLIVAAFLYLGNRVAGEGDSTMASVLLVAIGPTTHTWYLAYLLAYYLLALVLPSWVRGALVPVALLGSVFVSGEPLTRFFFLLAVFFLGDLTIRSPRVVALLKRPWSIAIAAVVALSSLILGAAAVTMRYEWYSLPGVLGGFVVLSAIFSAMSSTAVVRLFAGVGRDSLVYYLTHWVVVAATAHVLATLNMTDGLGDVVTMVAGGLLVSFVAAQLQRRFASVSWLYQWPARRVAGLSSAAR